jgi:O-antigen ligase/polysaccharide polymerase Wzy-like membrane protein
MRVNQRAGPRHWDVRWVIFVLALHVAIGAIARASEPISTAYDVLTVGGAVVVVLRTRRLEWVGAAVGYVAGADVFWRMTGASVIWPATGKFAVAGLLALAMFRFFPGWRRVVVPALYLAMFVPGVILSIRFFGLWESRGPIAFNASGPLALAACAAFFSQARMRVAEFRLMLWAVVPPLVATATTVIIGTLSAGSIKFTGESNFLTSGGGQPTTVSAVLGFGVVACSILAATERNPHLRVLEIALALCFLGEALLTFSRGGVLSMVVALVLASLVMARQVRRAGRAALLVGVLAAVAGGAILLLLNVFSGGKLIDRYEEKTVSRRDLIVRDDLDRFRQHPFVGVGIGVAQTERPRAIKGEPAHTEYSRLLAEQGLFGAVAIAALVTIAIGALLRAQPGLPSALVAAFAGWSFTEMAHSATRIALISYSVGLAVAAARLIDDDAEASAHQCRSATLASAADR